MKQSKDPIFERKVDLSKNGDKIHISQIIQKNKEKSLRPLRIDSKTVIYVTDEKCNEAYRNAYLDKLSKRKILD